MKILMMFLMALMLSANVMSAEDDGPSLNLCPVGGCEHTVSCQLKDGNGVVKGSFLTGGLSYAVAGAIYIFVEDGGHEFYRQLRDAAEQANALHPGSVDMSTIPDLAAPLNPVFNFD